MSVSLQGCHRNCNQKGVCHSSVDESGLTFYSFCTCDRDHGGFDCSDELVSPNGNNIHVSFLKSLGTICINASEIVFGYYQCCKLLLIKFWLVKIFWIYYTMTFKLMVSCEV